MKTSVLIAILLFTTSFAPDLATTIKEDFVIICYTPCVPQFPGGDNELLKFLCQNIQYPACRLDYDTATIKVMVRFDITPTGKVINAKLFKGEYGAFSKEALRVVNSMPDFIPCGNTKDTTRFILPFRFGL